MYGVKFTIAAFRDSKKITVLTVQIGKLMFRDLPYSDEQQVPKWSMWCPTIHGELLLYFDGVGKFISC